MTIQAAETALNLAYVFPVSSLLILLFGKQLKKLEWKIGRKVDKLRGYPDPIIRYSTAYQKQYRIVRQYQIIRK